MSKIGSNMTTSIGLSISMMIVGACAADADAPGDGDDTGTVAEQISVAGPAVTHHGPTALKLAATSQQTCFLSGIEGMLSAIPPDLASAEVFLSGGSWFVNTSGSGVTATVTCVNVPFPGPSMELSFENNIAHGEIAVKAHRRCFLRRVASSIGLHINPENSILVGIRVGNDGENWSMATSFVDEDTDNADFGEGIAVCIDVPSSKEAFGFPVQGNLGLVQTSTLGNGLPVSNTECALSEVTGGWDTTDPLLGHNVGIVLANDPAHETDWKLTTRGARSGRVSCWQ